MHRGLDVELPGLGQVHRLAEVIDREQRLGAFAGRGAKIGVSIRMKPWSLK